MNISGECPERAEMMSVSEILRTVTGSCDFGSIDFYSGLNADERRTAFWKDVIQEKASDSGFGHLVDNILTYGFHGSAVGWSDGQITEGHHRLVAAILLGMDEVPVYPWGLSGDDIRHTADAHHSHDAHGIDVEV